jgi:von Willebrand factor type A domain
MPDAPGTETENPKTDAATTTDAPTPATAEPPVTDAGAEASEPAPAAPAPAAPAPAPPVSAVDEQSSLAAPAPPAPRGLSYAVDIVFCIDVTGSMDPIIDAVKANALRFYDDVQENLTAKGKNVDELRVRVIAFRDFAADGEAALEESPFYRLPEERGTFSEFVNGLIAQGGGDAPESGLEAVALAMNSEWTTRGDRRRQVVVVWTDQPANPLDPTVVPAELRARVPGDFSALTDLWEDAQGPLGASSKRLILFAPDGPGWSDISAVWENVVHHPSQAGGGLSDVDYGTIVDSIGNSV